MSIEKMNEIIGKEKAIKKLPLLGVLNTASIGEQQKGKGRK